MTRGCRSRDYWSSADADVNVYSPTALLIRVVKHYSLIVRRHVALRHLTYDNIPPCSQIEAIHKETLIRPRLLNHRSL